MATKTRLRSGKKSNNSKAKAKKYGKILKPANKAHKNRDKGNKAKDNKQPNKQVKKEAYSCIAISQQPFEEITKLEIAELIGSEGSIENSIVSFSSSLEGLCMLSYKAQSITRLLVMLNKEDINSLEDIGKIDVSDDIFGWLTADKTFLVRCRREGNHTFSSNDVERKLGEMIIDKFKDKKHAELKVSLDKPDVLVYAFLNNKVLYLGIDFAGIDLSKREYKIFSGKNSLKGTTAYSLMRLTGFQKDKKEVIVDPFCGSGEIAIEAGLYAANYPVNYYTRDKFMFLKFDRLKHINLEKFFSAIDRKINKDIKSEIIGYDGLMNNVKSAQRNAKISGILKSITLSKISIDWIDTKFKEGEISRVATFLPMTSKKMHSNDMQKLYHEFFYQLDFILDKSGTAVVLCNNKELVTKEAEGYKFRCVKELILPYENPLYILSFTKALTAQAKSTTEKP